MSKKVERNYLEINSIKDLKVSINPNENCKIVLVDPPDFQLNKFFYKQVGKEYRWIDRLVWDDNKWISYVENPKVKTYILKDSENLVGSKEKGYRALTNIGSDGGQEVPHLHFHIFAGEKIGKMVS